MAKNTALDGPTNNGPVRVVDRRGGLDLELAGPEADAVVGGIVTVRGSVNVRGNQLASHQPLARYRAQAARSRLNSGVAITAWLGDSITEGFNASKRSLRWVDHLARLLNGPKGYTVRYLPASGGVFGSTNVPADWPGSQQPWTYSGTITGNVAVGADLHSANLASGASMSTTFFGDRALVVYTRTPTGPAAAAVSIDGVGVGTINAQGSQQSGQTAMFGTVGDYSAHTIQITATGAAMVLEGLVVHDGTGDFIGIPLGAVEVLGFGHSGLTSGQFVSNTTWARSLAQMCGNAGQNLDLALLGIALGVNDANPSNNVSPSTYRDNLVAIMRLVDTEVDNSGVTADPGFLLIKFPTEPDSYLDAAWEAAKTIGLDRCSVLDLRAQLPSGGSSWSLMDSFGHPNDFGHLWVANRIADHIDGTAAGPLPQMLGTGPVVNATDPPTSRSAWTESLGVTAGQPYDTAGAPDTTVRERRHRIWFETGTYEARIRYEQRTANGGTLQVLVGGTSLGTVSTAGTDGTITGDAAALGTVTIDTPGSYPVVIRKTSANGTVRFVRLHLRKTG